MAANRGKDRPPAYTESHQASASSNRKSNHSTAASELRRDMDSGQLKSSEYLELTFSVMIRYHGTTQPIVLAIDEEYETLFDDFEDIFDNSVMRVQEMSVIWGKDWILQFEESRVTKSSITAMLRLLKSRNGKDYIVVQ